ncbi:hypothetical protein EZS27_042679, partial [termite gut metagenome]
MIERSMLQDKMVSKRFGKRFFYDVIRKNKLVVIQIPFIDPPHIKQAEYADGCQHPNSFQPANAIS